MAESQDHNEDNSYAANDLQNDILDFDEVLYIIYRY